MRILGVTTLLILLVGSPAAAQLTADWMVPAVAHTHGARGTFWRTDVSLHNPHDYDLPVVVQLLPTDTANHEVSTLWLTLFPYETFNLWDVLGGELFDYDGTGAMLVYADPDLPCDPMTDCEFLVTSRTYTVDPRGGAGEFGQTVAGVDFWDGVDWDRFGYVAGILNDGGSFRCNVGMSSWAADWITVWVDVQDADGAVIATHSFEVPPFGHVQRRLPTTVFGGSLVFYLMDGPVDAEFFPYASVVDQLTGDPSYLPAIASQVGSTAVKAAVEPRARPDRPDAAPAPESLAARMANTRSRQR